MIYLQTGFAGEGSTDHDFLAPLLSRLTDDIIRLDSDLEFELPDPVSVLPAGRPSNKPGDVIAEVADRQSHLDLLFYHTDAAGDIEGAYANRVEPVRLGLARAGVRTVVIGVVPRRETEAWALADSAGLCRALGVDAEKVPIPSEFRPSHVEAITDPKKALKDFSASVRTRGYRFHEERFTFLGSLAMSIGLNVVREVPQVARTVEETRRHFRERGWIA